MPKAGINKKPKIKIGFKNIFKRKDNTYGFEEYRRDKETHDGWYKVNIYEHNIYLTEEEAFANACKYVHWLRQNNKMTDL